MYMKTPLKQQKTKQNRRVISGGKPAERKKKLSDIFITDGTASSHGRPFANGKKPAKSKLPAFTPWKVILASVVIGICGLIYIGHVFSTQQALMEVQQLENEFNKTQRLYNEKRLEYDRMVGPKQIYQQAREQGFVNAGPADQIIYLNR